MRKGEDFYVLDTKGSNFTWASVGEALGRDGVVVLRNLIAADAVDAVAASASRVLAKPALLGSVGYYRKGYTKRMYDPLLLGSPTPDVVLDNHILDVVTEYVGGECWLAECTLKHDEGSDELYFPMHSDFTAGSTWTQREGNPVISAELMQKRFCVGAMMYLHDTTDGAFCYAIGTHALGAPHGSSLNRYPQPLQSEIEAALVRIEGCKGDVVLFDDRGFHGPEQPVTVPRTVLIWDFYERKAFKDRTKTPIPVLPTDLGRLSQRQLSWLGIGADGPMIPYDLYHMRGFDKTPHYRTVRRIIELLQRWDMLKVKLRRIRNRLLPRRKPKTAVDYSE